MAGIDCDLDVKLAWSSVRPPAFPSPHQYQSCYCEENVYLLVQALSARLTVPADSADFVPAWDVWAVFISNEDKSTLLLHQKASQAPEADWPVVWDYHVVAAVSCTLLAADGTQCGTQTWIYDADSILTPNAEGAQPIPFDMYISATFPQPHTTPRHFWPVFRLVPAADFLAVFASDRSHMKSVSAQDPAAYTWYHPPPSWPLIRGSAAQSAHNLMTAFVDVRLPAHGGPSDPRFGVLCDYTSFCSLKWAAATPGATLGERQRPAQAGGRVSSSLFPAYLHSAQEHRAHTPDSIPTSPP